MSQLSARTSHRFNSDRTSWLECCKPISAHPTDEVIPCEPVGLFGHCFLIKYRIDCVVLLVYVIQVVRTPRVRPDRFAAADHDNRHMSRHSCW